MTGMLLLFAVATAQADCKWCVEKDAAVTKEVIELAKLEPKEQLKRVRKKKVCVKLLESRRPKPPKFFYWGQVEANDGWLVQVTTEPALVGKTLCKGELGLSRECMTIALADDAPRSTLLHEYLHVRQAQKDKKWCPLSIELWKRKPTQAEERLMRDKEWDVHRFLWKNRDKLKFGLEDEIAVLSETLEEAKARTAWDSEAAKYVGQEKMSERLGVLLDEYKKRMNIK